MCVLSRVPISGKNCANAAMTNEKEGERERHDSQLTRREWWGVPIEMLSPVLIVFGQLKSGSPLLLYLYQMGLLLNRFTIVSLLACLGHTADTHTHTYRFCLSEEWRLDFCSIDYRFLEIALSAR